MCQTKPELPSRKTAAKALLTQAMKDGRLAFYECSRKWMVEDRKKIMSATRATLS
jgi:hypothetical protein